LLLPIQTEGKKREKRWGKGQGEVEHPTARITDCAHIFDTEDRGGKKSSYNLSATTLLVMPKEEGKKKVGQYLKMGLSISEPFYEIEVKMGRGGKILRSQSEEMGHPNPDSQPFISLPAGRKKRGGGNGGMLLPQDALRRFCM